MVNAPSAFADTASFTAANADDYCQTWTVPEGVSSVHISAVGALGGVLEDGGYPGLGDGVSARLSGLSSGQSLDVCVDYGGGGLSGARGGGAWG